jgi:hypothetical protein
VASRTIVLIGISVMLATTLLYIALGFAPDVYEGVLP